MTTPAAFYRHHHDSIEERRERSPFWTRRYAYHGIQSRIARHVSPAHSVLDVGCGEGSLALELMGEGARVTAVDLSQPNVERARDRMREAGRAPVAIADAVSLPFPDSSFDVVVSSHVIEHLEDPRAALREIARVTRGVAVVAMPTCFNPAALLLVGGADYWSPRKRTLVAPLLGLWRVVLALLSGEPGPQEGYAGRDDLPHVWRFPWRLLSLVRSSGFDIVAVEGGPPVLPYLPERSAGFRRLQLWLDRHSDRFPLRYLGYGTHVIAKPR